jgi:uncharacterized protein YbaP (TraB family)
MSATTVVKRRLPAFAIFLGLYCCGPAFADPGNHPLSMWQVQGVHNRVFLLGSIHLLRKEDYPIPDAIYEAYRESASLFMELDMDDSDPLADQMLANELGLIQGDGSLKSLLGPAAYARAQKLAESEEIPLHLLDSAEPWYAAIQVELIMLLRIGFSPLFGIESHLAEMARADGKEIYGLETTRQQLELLDKLSARAQRDMFMQTLEDVADLADSMNSLITAWHKGNSVFLEDSLLNEMRDDYAELHEIIVLDRNVAWSNKIAELLTHEENYLIVVGALHLVGESGVPELLRKDGFSVSQMHQSN